MASAHHLVDVDENCIAALEEGRRVAGADRWLDSISHLWDKKQISAVSDEILPLLRAALYQLTLLPVKPTPAAYFFALLNKQPGVFHHLLYRSAVNQLADVPLDGVDDAALRDTGIKLLEQFLGSSTAVISSDLQAHTASAFAVSLLSAHPRTAPALGVLGALLTRKADNTTHVLKSIVPVLSEGKAATVKAAMQMFRVHLVEKESGHEALFTLVQHILLRVPKKAKTELRSNVAHAALDVFQLVPQAARTKFAPRLARFLTALSRNAADVSRAVAVEACSAVLMSPGELCTNTESRHTLLVAALEVVAGRVADKCAAIRAKALQQLAHILTSVDEHVAPIAQELMVVQGVKLCKSAEDCMQEGSAAVRRGAVDLLAALLGQHAAPHTPAALRAMLGAGLDPSLLVRKAALIAMDRVQAAHPTEEALQHYWIALLLPRVMDPEPTVQSTLLDLLQDRILLHPAESPLWAPLEAGLVEAPEVQRFLVCAATMLAKSGMLKKSTVSTIEAMHSAQGKPSTLAAMLCATFAAHAPTLVDPKLALNLACTLLEKAIWECNHNCLCALLKCINHLHAKLSSMDLKRLHSLLVPPLILLHLPAGLVSPFIGSLLALRKGKVEFDKGAWANQLIERCDLEVARVALEGGTSSEQTVIAVWITGELVAQQAVKLPQRLSTLLQALVATDTPVSVCAAAWLALGKLTLTDIRLAKKLIAPMVKELQTHASAVVRNNIMLVLGDLAVQFPSLVDNYTPSLARCVRDSNETVRRQALSMLGRLVGQDYVKLRGPLLLAFVVALTDESETVKDTASDTLEALSATKKLTALFFHSFLQIMLQLNKSSLPGGEIDASLGCLTLAGEANAPRRLEVYEKLLSMLSDEQRLQLTARLHEEILGVSPIEPPHFVLMSDTLALLQSPAAKVSKHVGASGSVADGEVIAEDGVNGAEEALSDAKSALLGKVARKALIEAAVPVLASLKCELEQLHSPLLKPLMAYFAQLAAENKTEMERFLSENKPLERELQYEQRVQQQQQQQKKRRVSLVGQNATTVGPKSPIAIAKSPAKLRNAARSPVANRAVLASETIVQAVRMPRKELPVLVEKEKEKENETIMISPKAMPKKRWSVALPPVADEELQASVSAKKTKSKSRTSKRASVAAAIDEEEEEEGCAAAPLAKRGRGRPRKQPVV